MNLNQIGKMAWKEAKRLKANGEVPLVLGVEGMLALMYKSIADYQKLKDGGKVLELAAYALHCLSISVHEEQASYSNIVKDRDNGIELDKFWPEQESPTRDEVPPPPAHFDGWQTNPQLAANLKDWLIDNSYWTRITGDQRLGIEEVIAGDVDEIQGSSQEEEDQDSFEGIESLED